MAGKAARIYDNLQVPPCIRRKFVAGTDFTNTNTAQVLAIGVVPAGSMPVATVVRKDVACDGTGVSVSIGNTANNSALMTTATAAPASTGAVVGVLYPSIAADALTPGQSTINLYITPGTTPTVGTFEVLITFYPFAT